MTDRELMQKVLSFLETNYLVMCSQFHMQKDMLADDLRKRLAQPDEWNGLTDEEIVGTTCECIDEGMFNMDCAKDFARAIESKLRERNYVETNT